MLVASILALVVGLAAFGLWGASRVAHRPVASASADVRPIGSLAVLPFQSLGTTELDRVLELGLADTLITRLSRATGLSVRPLSAVRQFSNTGADLLDAGRRLRVEAILEGNIQRDGNAVRITARLVRVTDGTIIWSGTFEDRAGSVFVLQDSVSTQVASALIPRLTTMAQARVIEPETSSPAAHQAYLKGRFFWGRRTADGLRKAVDHLEAAVRLDSSYALAHAALADTYVILPGYDQTADQHEHMAKARASAQKALALDPTLAEPHATLALIAMNYDWDWVGAERLYRRAIELNPSYSTARAWYGEYLAFMGRFDEGLAQIRRAQELDPLSLIIATDVGKVLIIARRYDEAVAHLTKVLEMDPNFVAAQEWRWTALAMGGAVDVTIAEVQQRAKADPIGTQRRLAFLHGLAGRKQETRAHLDRLIALSGEANVSLIVLALLYGHAGDFDRAFALLDRMYDERADGVIAWKVEPAFDIFRHDSRFDALLRRVGLND